MNKYFDIEAAGCVLAGGKSRRMGEDKALLIYNGKTLIAHALEQFSGFSEVFISAAEPDNYVFTGARVIPDVLKGIGPLGGFISSLKAAGSDYVCFRPVDAPLFPAEIHSLLAGACLGKDAAVPVFGKSIEPLLACLSRSALPALEKLASEGNYKTSGVFPLLDTVYLDLDAHEMKCWFGDPSEYLLNANDPLTFEKIMKR